MFYGCLHSSNRSLVHLLDRWGLQCRSVPLETFQGVAGSERVQIEGPSEAIITSNHTIHLWEITRRDSGTEWRKSLTDCSLKEKKNVLHTGSDWLLELRTANSLKETTETSLAMLIPRTPSNPHGMGMRLLLWKKIRTNPGFKNWVFWMQVGCCWGHVWCRLWKCCSLKFLWYKVRQPFLPFCMQGRCSYHWGTCALALDHRQFDVQAGSHIDWSIWSAWLVAKY